MRVDLRTLEPNPMRDFSIDPIDDDIVEKLRQSIEEDGFWGGVVCRKVGEKIQIGAGHHRVKAALEAGVLHAEVYVVTHFDDSDMVRVYSRENATQRGNSGTALAGSVAAAIRLLAKAALTGNLSRFLERLSDRGTQTIEGHVASGDGIGEPLITRYFRAQHVHGMGQYTVQQQLANLKNSGAYARIMGEVQGEIERDRELARQQAEQQRLEVERKEREVKEAAERTRLAKEEEQRAIEARREASRQERAAKAERERAQAEEKRKEAEEAEAQAALKRKEDEALASIVEAEAEMLKSQLRASQADAQKKASEADKAAKATSRAQQETSRIFDFEGVSKHLDNTNQINAFREQVTSALGRRYLPLEEHEALAITIVQQYKHDVSGERIRDFLVSEMMARQRGSEADAQEDEQRQIRDSFLDQADRYQRQMINHIRGIASVSVSLQELAAKWPPDLGLPPVTEEFRQVLQGAKRELDRLVERIGS